MLLLLNDGGASSVGGASSGGVAKPGLFTSIKESVVGVFKGKNVEAVPASVVKLSELNEVKWAVRGGALGSRDAIHITNELYNGAQGIINAVKAGTHEGNPIDALKKLAMSGKGGTSYEDTLLALATMLEVEDDGFDGDDANSDKMLPFRQFLAQGQVALNAFALKDISGYAQALRGLGADVLGTPDSVKSQSMKALATHMDKVGELADKLVNANGVELGTHLGEAAEMMADAKKQLEAQKAEVLSLASNPKDKASAKKAQAALAKMEASISKMEVVLEKASKQFVKQGELSAKYVKLQGPYNNAVLKLEELTQRISRLQSGSPEMVTLVKQQKEVANVVAKLSAELAPVKEELRLANYELERSVRGTKLALGDYMEGFEQVLKLVHDNKDNLLGKLENKSKWEAFKAFVAGAGVVSGIGGGAALAIAAVLGTGGLALIPLGLGAAGLTVFSAFKMFQKIGTSVDAKFEQANIQNDINAFQSVLLDKLSEIRQQDDVYLPLEALKAKYSGFVSGTGKAPAEMSGEGMARVLLNAREGQALEFLQEGKLTPAKALDVCIHMMEQDPKHALEIIAHLPVSASSDILNAGEDKTFAANILTAMHTNRPHKTALILHAINGAGLFAGNNPALKAQAAKEAQAIISQIPDTKVKAALIDALNKKPVHESLSHLNPKEAARQLMELTMDDGERATILKGMKMADVANILAAMANPAETPELGIFQAPLGHASTAATLLAKSTRPGELLALMLPKNVLAAAEIMGAALDDDEIDAKTYVRVFRDMSTKDAGLVLDTMDPQKAAFAIQILGGANRADQDTLSKMSLLGKLLSPGEWYNLTHQRPVGQLLAAMSTDKAAAVVTELVKFDGSTNPKGNEAARAFSGMPYGAAAAILQVIHNNGAAGPAVVKDILLGIKGTAAANNLGPMLNFMAKDAKYADMAANVVSALLYKPAEGGFRFTFVSEMLITEKTFVFNYIIDAFSKMSNKTAGQVIDKLEPREAAKVLEILGLEPMIGAAGVVKILKASLTGKTPESLANVVEGIKGSQADGAEALGNEVERLLAPKAKAGASGAIPMSEEEVEVDSDEIGDQRVLRGGEEVKSDDDELDELNEYVNHPLPEIPQSDDQAPPLHSLNAAGSAGANAKTENAGLSQAAGQIRGSAPALRASGGLQVDSGERKMLVHYTELDKAMTALREKTTKGQATLADRTAVQQAMIKDPRYGKFPPEVLDELVYFIAINAGNQALTKSKSTVFSDGDVVRALKTPPEGGWVDASLEALGRLALKKDPALQALVAPAITGIYNAAGHVIDDKEAGRTNRAAAEQTFAFMLGMHLVETYNQTPKKFGVAAGQGDMEI